MSQDEKKKLEYETFFKKFSNAKRLDEKHLLLKDFFNEDLEQIYEFMNTLPQMLFEGYEEETADEELTQEELIDKMIAIYLLNCALEYEYDNDLELLRSKELQEDKFFMWLLEQKILLTVPVN